MLGFFSDPEGEDEEALEDFVAAAKALRRDRPDAAVRAAHVSLSRPLLAEYSKKRRWFDAPPSVVVLVGGEDAPSGGVYHLDERDESNLDLGAWAARAALPLLAELTGGNFAAYANPNPNPNPNPNRNRNPNPDPDPDPNPDPNPDLIDRHVAHVHPHLAEPRQGVTVFDS